MVATRKTAAGVSAARTGCGWTAGTVEPKSRSWAKMVNHVRKSTGVVRVHRRFAVAVPRLRDGRAAAAAGGLLRTRRTGSLGSPGEPRIQYRDEPRIEDPPR